MCIILSLSLSVLKPSTDRVYLYLASAVGAALCTQWNWRGFALAVLGLFAILSYYFFLPNVDYLWEAGLGFAIILGFAITALSVEQVKQFIHHSSSEIMNHYEILV